ncbi:MAG: SpaA isopeptide-forming pilin-related protein [Gemmiger qucibialis]|nr:SpaA isopeptide-forming pilin-related protein [Gemmiger qucibialis]
MSRLNRKGNNTTGWARRLTALLITACLVMAMALPVYAEVDLLPDAPDEVELLEYEQGTASGEDTVPPEQNAATPVPDAATPEPEQSAEPEQPAPTETPEPTAEPTPTPEPAATATATPVPTVTPTATPEPTEQPQKMYAAKSVDNVQAVSEGGVPATYTLYFAVPDGWNDCTVVKIYAVGEKDPKKAYYLDMQEADKTKDGRKIYSVVLNHNQHYPYGGLNGLEFRGYKGEPIEVTKPAYKIVIAEVDQNLGSKWMTFVPGDNYIGGDYYDGESKSWSTYTVGHKHFAGKEMAFENKTSETLTNVQAWFYEPDESGKLIQVGGPIPLNSDGVGSGIAFGSTANFAIPDGFCSFVRFTAGDDNTEISEYYNFYNEEVTGEKQKRFQYSEGQCYCYMYNGIKDATWGRPGAIRIYYDATFSKMALNGDTGDFSIPKANNSETIYYRIKGGNGNSEKGTLVKDDTNENLYYVDIPQEYSSNSSIIFSGEEINDDNTTKGNGVSTAWLPIPTDDKNCFYADTNDNAVYSNGQRGGYWAPKGTLRDAETWKDTTIVDIKSVPFTEKSNTKYVTSTLYDYYTDYELNGKNRDSYGNCTGASYRNWVTFREFDQALSDYYKNAKAQYPIYTGHFQPSYSDWGYTFAAISAALNLWGLNNDFKNENRFMAINNSTINENGNGDGEHYDYAYQGLVADTTSTGKATGEPLLKGTETVEPHFNKDFLLGENSKKAKLGEVYDNVAFPFTKKVIFDEDQGVDYWYFDSKDTTLYLKRDSGQNSDSKYFLQSTNNRESSMNVDSSSNSQGHYGYFPFNETATPHVASTYNYGFGTKLQMDFTLTDDGKVETNKIVDGKNVKTNIKFFFSGDDDVWVFIDGKLALDVGGAHGKVSGLLEFGETDNNKNSVTAYVSKVKTGGTSKNDQDGKKGNSAVKTVTYNGESIPFYAQGTPLPLDKGKKHTLTMYYMERGMWESNMAVAFNFPDNNELQVQKEVDLSNVTEDFKNCFKNQKIFNFTIQNQATHYGTTEAAGSDTTGTQSKKVDLNADVYSIAAATPGNENDYIFRLDTNPEQGSGQDTEQVLHWYARFTDTEPVSAARKKRYGILTLKDPINIKDMRFLTFQVYVDSNDGGGGGLSLNNLYLELLDDQESPVQKGSLGTSGINGATYGSVEVKTDQWVTVKLDLNKMKAQDGFNDKVKTIRVGDNYSRHIYFRNFTFIPKAVPREMTGFTTDQEKIPDYGSATSGKLENAKNAQYTSTKDNDTQLVDEDGRFVLEDGETVTFSDQFRRGSYISLKEELNQNLYDTTWTVYENGQAVAWTEPTGTSSSHVTFGTPRSLDGQKVPADGPDDDRTEVYVNEEGVRNEGYTKDEKPGTNTIVFRSYKDPDETSSTLTKLKVKYVNTVKTGGLKIQKKAAEGETLTGTYKFKVTFNDVGGEGLEEKPIIKYVEINMSDESNKDHTATITGIPVGTRYTIEEVTPEDDSRLQSVTVPANNEAHVINNTMVEGVIKESNDPEVTAIFTNTQRTLINIEFDKLWKDADGTGNLSTANQPDTIYIQLQRRLATSTSDTDWTLVKYPADSTKDYVTIKRGDNGWQFTFSGLDQYQINTDNSQTNYIYRIVEGTVENGSFTPAAEDGTITINGNTYVVTAKATPNSETNSADSSTGNTATVTTDGTITGGSGKIELTNKLQNPKFVLDIIKKDAERNNEDQEVFLKDVEFKLEKLKAETTTEGEPQWVVDKDYQFDSTKTDSITATTNDKGEITNVFKNLKPGTYRLTETKAHAGYNLLAQPIVIQFTQDGKCSIDGQIIAVGDKFTQSGNTYTMTLTVLNRKTPELPHTGADAPSLWLLIGMPLAVAGLLIFTFRYNRKGGRRH